MALLPPVENTDAASLVKLDRTRPKNRCAPQKPISNSSSHTYDTLFGNRARLAFDAVFDTLELAELILGELCMRDLLISVQRVCRHWKATIDGSPKLQEALFFRPINNKRLVYRGKTHSQHQDMTKDVGITAGLPTQPSSPVYEHPLITFKCSKIRKYSNTWLTMPDAEIMGHPDASWRRQLLTQPPLAELKRWSYHDGVGVPNVIRASPHIGLTMGDCAEEYSLRFPSIHERWSWQKVDWDHASAVSKIEPARFATCTEGDWIAE